ncbi:Rieske 2Fe-2S domain-containing protein [Pseudonocardia sp.]|uniref:Rieske 2Fe-2S domain-containing protein n=1 Tax=Pseudonocardia sp. TaxID=60912 RepID=UPI003D114309
MPDPSVADDPDQFVEVADDDELWDGEMESYDVGDTEVLLVKIDGQHYAYRGICPHQSVALVEGSLDGRTLTCRAHEWSFDATNGAGINPRDTCLTRHEVRVRDGVVLVSRRPVPAEVAAGQRC